jgi:hypothetical protein
MAVERRLQASQADLTHSRQWPVTVTLTSDICHSSGECVSWLIYMSLFPTLATLLPTGSRLAAVLSPPICPRLSTAAAPQHHRCRRVGAALPPPLCSSASAAACLHFASLLLRRRRLRRLLRMMICIIKYAAQLRNNLFYKRAFIMSQSLR